MENEKKKFYKTTWFLIVLGVFLPVIAIIVLWLAQKERSQKQKVVFTVIFAVWALIGLISNGAKNKSPKVEQPAPSVVETTIQEETETISESEETTTEETNEEQSTETESEMETDSNSETVSETVDADTLVVAVKEVTDGQVGTNEKITDISLQEKNLVITIDLSGANTNNLSTREIAISRISSITDAILELDDSYCNAWETVTVDFGSDGTAVLDKSMIKDEGYGKFFKFNDDILKDANSAENSTTESNTTTSNNEYDALQNIFLSLTYSSTQNDLLSMVKSDGLTYTVSESNTRPRQISYKIAFDEEISKNRYAAEGDNIVVLFNQDDGTFMNAKYENHSKFMIALFYCYGWDSQVSSENKYSGYYYYKPSDYSNKGIVIEYSNGNKKKTNYYACTSAEKALEMVSD